MFNEKIAFVFPGQGYQYVGMGHDLYQEFDVVKHTFEHVSEISHKDIAKICFSGPKELLNKPELTSLATFAQSVSIARIIEKYFNKPLYKLCHAITGHSMGQYSALHCVDSLKFEDAIRLLSARSGYMSMTSGIGGGMACIIGLDREEVERCILTATGHGYVAISNHNAYDQFTISGQNDALDIVVARAKEKGAKISKRLNVAVPAHCALMENAQVLLKNRLSTINICSPKTNWFSNQTGDIMSDPQDVKNALADQMTHGVRWLDIMEKLPAYNIKYVYELGPGKSLTGLINRAGVDVKAFQTDKLKNVKSMLQNLGNMISR